MFNLFVFPPLKIKISITHNYKKRGLTFNRNLLFTAVPRIFKINYCVKKSKNTGGSKNKSNQIRRHKLIIIAVKYRQLLFDEMLIA